MAAALTALVAGDRLEISNGGFTMPAGARYTPPENVAIVGAGIDITNISATPDQEPVIAFNNGLIVEDLSITATGEFDACIGEPTDNAITADPDNPIVIRNVHLTGRDDCLYARAQAWTFRVYDSICHSQWDNLIVEGAYGKGDFYNCKLTTDGPSPTAGAKLRAITIPSGGGTGKYRFHNCELSANGTGDWDAVVDVAGPGGAGTTPVELLNCTLRASGVANSGEVVDLKNGSTANVLVIGGSGSGTNGKFTVTSESSPFTFIGTQRMSPVVFTALNNQPPSSNFATLDTRNGIAVLDFDASTDESAIFLGILPSDYNVATGLTVDIDWMATSATSGTCRWEASFERMNTDEDSDSFAAANSAGTVTSGTSGIINRTSITFVHGSEMDSLAAGEPFRLKITRDANGTTGTDDMAGDSELVAVRVRES